MRLGKKIWIVMAVAALIVVVVLLVVLLPAVSSPGGTPTPTPTYTAPLGPTATGIGYPTPTATGIGYPTPTATGIGYPTPTATGVGYPTPTATGIGYPTPTATGIGYPTPTPTETALIFWNQSSVAVSNGSYFWLAVNVTNVKYLSTGQFDVFYNRSMVGVRSSSAGLINDTLDRSMYCYDDGEDIYCDPATGCGWESVSPFSYGGIDIGYGNDTATSGCLRILWETSWAHYQTYGGCQGGNGSGLTGNGWIAVIRFRAISRGTCEIAFGAGPHGGTKQVNQIVDGVMYEDYSYGDSVLVWGPNVQVTVQ